MDKGTKSSYKIYICIFCSFIHSFCNGNKIWIFTTFSHYGYWSYRNSFVDYGNSIETLNFISCADKPFCMGSYFIVDILIESLYIRMAAVPEANSQCHCPDIQVFHSDHPDCFHNFIRVYMHESPPDFTQLDPVHEMKNVFMLHLDLNSHFLSPRYP